MNDSLYQSALWSDRFFNSDLIEDNNELAVHDAAVKFVKENPDCPYDAKWLTDNYVNRL